MSGNAAHDEQVRQNVDHVDAVEPSVDTDGEAFSGELVDDIEQPVFASLLGSILQEVIRPDIVWPFGGEPHARVLVQPQALTLGLFDWNFQPFPSPDAFDALVVDRPTSTPEKFRDPSIAIATVLTSERNDIGGQPLFVGTATW